MIVFTLFRRSTAAALAATLLMAGYLSLSAANAGIDDVEVALARAHPPVLDWDPAVRLSISPGETVRLHIAAGKALRLGAKDGVAGLADMSFWAGDGNGIRRLISPEKAPDSLFLRATTSPRIIDVALSGAATHDVNLHVSVGEVREDYRGHAYKNPVSLPLETMRLHWREPRQRQIDVVTGRDRSAKVARSSRREVRDYSVARPGAPFSFTVDGPTRLRVETRLLPETGGALHRPYRIELAQDGQPMRPLEFEGTWDLRRLYSDETGAEQAVARAETGFLTIPAGASTIRFEVSRPMLVRVDAIGGNFASPKANTVSGYREALRSTAQPSAVSPDVDWGGSGGSAHLGGGELSAEDLLHQARRLSRTNALANGATVATDTASRLAAKPGMPASVERAADRLSQVYGYFRDLYPIAPADHSLETLHDDLPALLSPGQTMPEGPAAVVPAGILQDLAVDAVFYRARAGRRLEYAIPVPAEQGRMRLLVDRRTLSGAVRLRVVPNKGSDFPVVISPSDELPAMAYFRPVRGQTFGARDHAPGSRPGDFGALEFDLPLGVSRVTLLVETAPDSGVPVALQARQPRVSRLDQPGFRGEISRLGAVQARSLMIGALSNAVDCEPWLQSPAACVSAATGSAKVAAAETLNDLLPLLRLLRSRERLVFEDVRDTRSPLAAAGRDGLDGPVARRHLSEGNGLLEQGYPIAALEEYETALRLSTKALSETIVFRQIAALEKSGEDFLAGRMLRRLALDCDARALDALSTRFAEDGDDARQLGVEVRRAVCAKEAVQAGRIAALLAASGQPEWAAKLVTILPDPALSAELAALTRLPHWTQLGVGAPAVENGWIGADSLVVSNGGSMPVKIPARGLIASWHRATPMSPVRIRAHRDGTLRIRLRPILAQASGQTVGSVRIDAPSRSRLVPVAGDTVSEGLVPAVHAGFGLGAAIEELLPVREGEAIVISPTGLSVTVELDYTGLSVADQSFSRAKPAQIEELRDLVLSYRAEPFAQADLLPKAARLGAPWFGDGNPDEMQRFWRDVEAMTDWERVTLLSASAGTTAVSEAIQRFQAPRLRVRAALAPDLDRSAQPLSASRILKVSGGASFRLRLSLAAVPGVTVPTARVVLEHPDGSEEVVTLTRTQPQSEREIVLADAFEAIRLRLESPMVNAFVTADIDGGIGAPDADLMQDRFYDVATTSEPVIYRSAGPEVLRIDEWRDGRILTRFVLSDGEVILAPEAAQERGLFRLHRLVPAQAMEAPIATAAGQTTEIMPDARSTSPRPGAIVARVSLPVLASAADLQVEPGGFGSWEFGVAARKRGDTRDVRDGEDRFLELSAVYRRYWAEWDLYTLSEILARSRSDGPVTLGLQHTLTWPDRFAGLDLEIDAALFTQRFDETAHRLRLSASASRSLRFSDELSLDVGVEAFFNRLSHNAMPGGRPAPEVDRDVYSDYLRDHSRGITLSAGLDYRPYEDLGIHLTGSLRTNEDFNIGALDQVAFGLGWDHQIGDFYYKVSAEKRFFLADEHRSVSSNTMRYDIVARWDRWRVAGDRISLEARASHREDRPGIEGGVFLRWNFGGGFEDHAPGTVSYRDLRELSRLDRITGGIDD